jgi:Mce-associated membrane protein
MRALLGVLRRCWGTVWVSAALVVVLSVALVGGVGLTGWYGWRWIQAQGADSDRAAAVAAAETTVTNFMTISAASADRDLQRTLDGATGDFKKQYQADLDQVKTAVSENKVTSTGQVLRAAVVDSGAKSATVLLAVDATVKNTKAPDGRQSHYRIRVAMAKTDGKWLVSKLDFVG